MSTTNTNIPFSVRHKPRGFGDLVFADPMVRQQLELYAQRRTHRSLILYGTYGTAKSTAARVIVDERRTLLGITGPFCYADSGGNLNGRFASIENGIGNQVLEGDPQPYVIIDEIDQLTTQNQLALRQLMDAYPVIRIIGTTNNINAVDGGIRSRSECIEIKPPQPNHLLPRCHAILATEGVVTTDATLLNMIRASPSLRDLLQALEELVAVLLSAQAAQPLGQHPTPACTSQ